MNDQHELLASGYLDGALTDEERARAEADPEVMAAVERMATLRSRLADVERPNPARRDAAIKAALDVFTAERTPAASATSLSARRGSRWLVPAAAAAVLAIVAGGVIASRDGQDDRDQAGEEDAASVLDTSERVTGGQVLSDSAATATTNQVASPELRADERAPQPAPPATEAAGTTGQMYDVTTEGVEDLPVITSRRELTRLADADEAAFGAPACDAGTWLGRAVVRIDGRDTVVDVFLNERASRVRALDSASCEVLLAAPAPSP